MTEFELFNLDRSEYFRGSIKKRDRSPTRWEIVCLSARGTHKSLDLIDLQHKHKAELIIRVKEYAKKSGFKIRNLDGKYQKSE